MFMIMKALFTLGVFWIICNQKNEVLLCLRSDISKWNLPWWALESGELPWDWVVREVREETGLDTEVVSLVGVYHKPYQDDIVFVFECRVIGGMMRENEEAKDICYFSYDKIPENTISNHRTRIDDFFLCSEIIMRKQ